jgi:hypothetical protein
VILFVNELLNVDSDVIRFSEICDGVFLFLKGFA